MDKIKLFLINCELLYSFDINVNSSYFFIRSEFDIPIYLRDSPYLKILPHIGMTMSKY